MDPTKARFSMLRSIMRLMRWFSGRKIIFYRQAAARAGDLADARPPIAPSGLKGSNPPPTNIAFCRRFETSAARAGDAPSGLKGGDYRSMFQFLPMGWIEQSGNKR